MTKHNSSGAERAKSEKSQRVLETPDARKERLAKKKAEEKEWAEKSGPVTVRNKDEESDERIEVRYYIQLLRDSEGKHDSCPFWVIDLVHDDAALPAMKVYAENVRENGNPSLADEIDEWVRSIESVCETEAKAQEEYDNSPELKETLAKAADAPTVKRRYHRR